MYKTYQELNSAAALVAVMPTMVDGFSPPDPPPPDDSEDSPTGHVDPPSDGGSTGVDNTLDSSEDEDFYEFSITVYQAKTVQDWLKQPDGPPIHSQINKVLNTITKHYPDVVVYSHITRRPIPRYEDGKVLWTKGSSQHRRMQSPTRRSQAKRHTSS